MSEADPSDPGRFIPLREVGHMIGGFSKRTVQRMIAAKELPRPVVVRKRPCLTREQVMAFMQQQLHKGGQ